MEFINRHKRLTFLMLTLFCIVAAIITLNYRKPTFIENFIGYVISPSQEVSGNIGGFFQSRINFISNLSELDSENQRLREENEFLLLEANRAKMLDKDNKELRVLLELSQRYPELSVVGADIIATDSSNWSNKFSINAGAKDGIADNMVILAGGGLVGRVYKAYSNYSQIITIVDDTSSVNAVSKRTGDTGFVRGDLRLAEFSMSRMENIDLNADIIENDEIVTSNLGLIYPPGITIGYVREVGTDSSGLFKYAIIETVVNFKYLETVLVVNESFDRELIDE